MPNLIVTESFFHCCSQVIRCTMSSAHCVMRRVDTAPYHLMMFNLQFSEVRIGLPHILQLFLSTTRILFSHNDMTIITPFPRRCKCLTGKWCPPFMLELHVE